MMDRQSYKIHQPVQLLIGKSKTTFYSLLSKDHGRDESSSNELLANAWEIVQISIRYSNYYRSLTMQ